MKPRQPPLARPMARHRRQVPTPARQSGGEDENGEPMALSAARNLTCRNCGTEAPLRAQHACYQCFGPLEVGYDTDVLARVTRAEIEAGPANMWRYAPLLPVGQDPSSRVTLNPGLTPLVRADALAD